ncbi:MAG: glycosyltransferase family 2 protein [Bacteroidetes bacterium]|nr:glycosyltransferase family 2 protein [Bacteroidota bacterium]
MGQTIVVLIYTLSLSFLLIYSLGQLHLTLKYVKHRSNKKQQLPEPNAWPMVTVQLPMYNEMYVAERLIKCIAELDYPHNKLEIQVLDDSDDETTQIIQKTIASLPSTLDIKLVRRPERIGFKAGALKYGTSIAKGDLLAIFDADFLPNPNFLKETVPQFQDEKVGVVQTRWEHLNKDYSMLTHFQAFGLDAHFTVEQNGRNLSNCFISFNGTAGIWRKQCIEDAGGWESDTLTEDLDLSYRAQLKGWKFEFLEDVGAPAELPVTLNAFKSQQYRWNKGAAETHKKVFGKVWNAKMPFTIKFHAILQLFKGLGFLSSMLLALTSVPIIFIRNNTSEYNLILHILGITLVCIVILSAFYYVSLLRFYPEKNERIWYFIKNFPLFISFSLGITLHNTLAVIEGYIGRKTPFIRTPKYNATESDSNVESNSYNLRRIHPLAWLELVLIGYFAYGCVLAVKYQDYSFFPFHLLIMLGYGMVLYFTFNHHTKLSKATS